MIVFTVMLSAAKHLALVGAGPRACPQDSGQPQGGCPYNTQILRFAQDDK
jgi:hypothetical protein